MKAIYKSQEGERLVRERYQALLKYWPVTNEQVNVPTSQGSTFVVISGPEDGPPLLLLHGGGSNSTMWMGDIRAFAQTFRVYCIDMIGEAGLSAPVRPSLASDAHAAWLDDVMNRLSIRRASIVGISLGGWLALDYAIRRPQRVEKVAALCPGGIGRQKVGIVFLSLLSRLFGKAGRRRLMERALGKAPIHPTPAMQAVIDFYVLTQRNFKQRMVKFPAFSDTALRGLKIPVLAIVGGRDMLFVSAQTKRRLEKFAPNARVKYLPDAGHLITGQIGEILEFLQSV
jgi:pimeloyl-ACP methyl ester carboxylesterase